MNSHGMQHDRAAAQQTIKAPGPARPEQGTKASRARCRSPAFTGCRATLPCCTTIGRVDASGRVAHREITDALRWQPGDRLEMSLTAARDRPPRCP